MRLPEKFGKGDVLVVNGNPRFLSNLLLMMRARRRGAGIIWWGHGWSPTSKPWRAAIRYRLMAMADVILLYTDAEAIALSGKIPQGRSVLGLNNTLDPEPSKRAIESWTPNRLAEFRRDQGLGDRQVLLFCGRLRPDPSTELDVAIRALSQLIESEGAQKYLLVVIGTGEDEERLRSLAHECRVSNCVRWQGEIFDEMNLAPWFLSAVCFVYPGAIGLSLIHSLIYGLPVVTHSDRKKHGPEIAALRHGSNGLLFERGNAQDLCRQISKIGSDCELSKRMSASALETVRTEYSFQRMVDRFSEAIEAAVGAVSRERH